MNIEPPNPEAIRDPELLALIGRCEALGVPDAVFPRVLARVPEYAKVHRFSLWNAGFRAHLVERRRSA